jgi:hypothetical protein
MILILILIFNDVFLFITATKEIQMQLLLHIPDELMQRFKQTVPTRKRSAFVAKLLEQALPLEVDPLYLAALEVERDATLNSEMQEWRNGLIGDGSLISEKTERETDATW